MFSCKISMTDKQMTKFILQPLCIFNFLQCNPIFTSSFLYCEALNFFANYKLLGLPFVLKVFHCAVIEYFFVFFEKMLQIYSSSCCLDFKAKLSFFLCNGFHNIRSITWIKCIMLCWKVLKIFSQIYHYFLDGNS